MPLPSPIPSYKPSHIQLRSLSSEYAAHFSTAQINPEELEQVLSFTEQYAITDRPLLTALAHHASGPALTRLLNHIAHHDPDRLIVLAGQLSPAQAHSIPQDSLIQWGDSKSFAIKSMAQKLAALKEQKPKSISR